MGVPSNKDYLSCVLADPRFAEGETTTSFLKELKFSPHGIEVVEPGMNTTVQVTALLLAGCTGVSLCGCQSINQWNLHSGVGSWMSLIGTSWLGSTVECLSVHT